MCGARARQRFQKPNHMEHDLTALIKEFFEKLSVPIDGVELARVDPHPLFQVKTTNAASLIGVGGETLRAANIVLRRIAERRFPTQTAFLVDVNGYHERHITEVRGSARLLADRARSFQHDVEMQPMNAYERMIVHATFAKDPNIATESQGSGNMRRVVLKYTSNKQPTTNDKSLFL